MFNHNRYIVKKSAFVVTSRHKKFVAVSIFLLLLISLVLLLPYFSKPIHNNIPAQANTLQTYSNSTYDISFSYPKDWKEVPPLTSGNGAIVSFVDPNYNTDFRSITLFASPKGYANTTPKFETNFTVSETTAYKQVIPAGQNPPQIYVYFEKNGIYYTFQFVDSMESSNPKPFYDLLDSLTFTE